MTDAEKIALENIFLKCNNSFYELWYLFNCILNNAHAKWNTIFQSLFNDWS